MTKQDIIATFDPNEPGLASAQIFGLPFSEEQSDIIIIPVPWEVTVSYGSGASKGPKAIFEASFQVDLMHQNFPDLWQLGIYMLPIPKHWKAASKKLKKLAQPIIAFQEAGGDLSTNEKLQKNLMLINSECRKLHDEVRELTTEWLQKGKKVVLLGGDHSTPLGYYEAMAKEHQNFGILHLDAHLDYRVAYESFSYSHASIMYNALQISEISKIVSVGIRDFCEQEVNIVKQNIDRTKVFADTNLKKALLSGKTWDALCDDIISQLPNKVLISFDIDGLLPWYCPNTGTPVPGGLGYEQVTFLLNKLAESGKTIIGFDLVEVAPGDDDWDGNVGARMLYHLCGVMAKSQGLTVGNEIVF